MISTTWEKLKTLTLREIKQGEQYMVDYGKKGVLRMSGAHAVQQVLNYQNQTGIDELIKKLPEGCKIREGMVFYPDGSMKSIKELLNELR